MSLRKIILNLLTLCLGIVGIVCGLLCLVCLIALQFWQGLGVGTVVLALLCLFCLGLAVMLSGRAAKRESKLLGGDGLRFEYVAAPWRLSVDRKTLDRTIKRHNLNLSGILLHSGIMLFGPGTVPAMVTKGRVFQSVNTPYRLLRVWPIN
jgi:hypothetical protein